MATMLLLKTSPPKMYVPWTIPKATARRADQLEPKKSSPKSNVARSQRKPSKPAGKGAASQRDSSPRSTFSLGCRSIGPSDSVNSTLWTRSSLLNAKSIMCTSTRNTVGEGSHWNLPSGRPLLATESASNSARNSNAPRLTSRLRQIHSIRYSIHYARESAMISGP